MKFELLFKKGEQVFRVQEGSTQFVITIKISNEIVTGNSYQLLAYRNNLYEILVDLIQYTNENGFQILLRDAILIDTSSDKIKLYELEIEIENEYLTKAGIFHNPENIDSYQTKFIANFEEFYNPELDNPPCGF